MKTVIRILCSIAFFSITIVGCKKEDAQEENNDNELITTVLLSIREKDSANAQEFSWKDVDGAGGAEPIIETVRLKPNKVYQVQVGVLDESQGTAVGITNEIVEEADVHRFYYSGSSGLGITVNGFDKDDNNLPLGLNTTWNTASPSTGSITITLRHYPNGGKEESDPVTSSKSTTDAEVVFPVEVIAP